MNVYEILNKLNINFEEVEHDQVFTAEESEKIKKQISGVGCKNLFLKDKEGRYFLVLIDDYKKANLKQLEKELNTSHLSFAKEEDLRTILSLKKGSVSPLGIINDLEKRVLILIDEDLKNKKLLMHPNINTKTISMEYDDLIKFMTYENHKYIIMRMGE